MRGKPLQWDRKNLTSLMNKRDRLQVGFKLIGLQLGCGSSKAMKIYNEVTQMGSIDAFLQSRAGEKERRCLKCHDDFLSDGPHHRVCSPCKKGGAWKAGHDIVSDYEVRA